MPVRVALPNGTSASRPIRRPERLAQITREKGEPAGQSAAASLVLPTLSQSRYMLPPPGAGRQRDRAAMQQVYQNCASACARSQRGSRSRNRGALPAAQRVWAQPQLACPCVPCPSLPSAASAGPLTTVGPSRRSRMVGAGLCRWFDVRGRGWAKHGSHRGRRAVLPRFPMGLVCRPGSPD